MKISALVITVAVCLFFAPVAYGQGVTKDSSVRKNFNAISQMGAIYKSCVEYEALNDKHKDAISKLKSHLSDPFCCITPMEDEERIECLSRKLRKLFTINAFLGQEAALFRNLKYKACDPADFPASVWLNNAIMALPMSFNDNNQLTVDMLVKDMRSELMGFYSRYVEGVLTDVKHTTECIKLLKESAKDE